VRTPTDTDHRTRPPDTLVHQLPLPLGAFRPGAHEFSGQTYTVGDLQPLGTLLVRALCESGVPRVPLVRRDQVLTMAAEVHRPTIAQAVALVCSQLDLRHELSDQTVARMTAEIGRFARRLALVDVPDLAEITEEHARGFIDEAVVLRSGAYAEPSIATRHLRRSSIRLFCELARQLHLVTGDPTLDIRLPPRTPGAHTRPFEDDEEVLGRVWSRHTLVETRWPSAWALGQATATSGESPQIQVRDLRLDEQRVWIHGSHKREPRWGHLTEWGVAQLAARVSQLGGDPEARVVFGGSHHGASGQASVSRALYLVLARAGLSDDPALRASSLPAWAGRKVFEQTGSIDAAARAIGARSLDAAARIIGWSWLDGAC